jgi:hypothetical protein
MDPFSRRAGCRFRPSKHNTPNKTKKTKQKNQKKITEYALHHQLEINVPFFCFLVLFFCTTNSRYEKTMLGWIVASLWPSSRGRSLFGGKRREKRILH